MRRFQGVRNLAGNGERFIEGDRAPRNLIPKRRPFHQFQHEGVRAARILKSIDWPRCSDDSGTRAPALRA